MRDLPATPRMKEIARSIIWFEAPEVSLADPVRFMAYAMARATAEDMAEIRAHVGNEDFIHAIDNAPPGIIDPRSWSYWNLVVAKRSPPPPMPVRHFE